MVSLQACRCVEPFPWPLTKNSFGRVGQSNFCWSSPANHSWYWVQPGTWSHLSVSSLWQWQVCSAQFSSGGSGSTCRPLNGAWCYPMGRSHVGWMKMDKASYCWIHEWCIHMFHYLDGFPVCAYFAYLLKSFSLTTWSMTRDPWPIPPGSTTLRTPRLLTSAVSQRKAACLAEHHNLVKILDRVPYQDDMGWLREQAFVQPLPLLVSHSPWRYLLYCRPKRWNNDKLSGVI